MRDGIVRQAQNNGGDGGRRSRFPWLTGLLLPLGLLTAFLLAERRIEPPFVELGLFANRRYAAATGIISAQFFCLFGMQLLLHWMPD